MQHLTTEILSHGQRVCRLYKKSLRLAEAWSFNSIFKYRTQALYIRKYFEDHKTLSPIDAKAKLNEGENYVKQMYCIYPYQFTLSPGGISYGRELPTPDWILDAWHPLEKAQYPEYFARRDVRKREYIERYEMLYGQEEGADKH